ncbi:hypothetical protein A3B64_05020 [candidate division WWE3 bacterium RIFCSPLOWO2_01_FULL_37_24]|uniref:Hemerythrin-like domain-containing protein n=1 Tax=candidate division WWE3 bacterium RIFCSPHIGHO2_02_FULL_38_14 TaxID=1802620 RepID=A0A1F4V9K2_UNCKA|nr:MAG: hypothetical protein A2793_02465 [candidate division WWE3 bacterium RIFCSPHIGHO2_01_FULL_38_45]OGC53809.1 MAG: hypothetical protein A3D91_03695 [candidate division WWE3 bacterium RIFCSPHIGHO2_02_FULL_38_14]OGC54530.1 MAG: hypothetical protein A3B64_05020 [candidate division WWE3 bacterium RIFCSPLOWO2_01_FULL_37_24]
MTAKRFVWDDSYSVKVPSIDEQHKKFFDITNQILDIIENTRSPDVKNSLILAVVELGRYALYHLSYEEECIFKFQCTECSDHPLSHDYYRKKVKEYLKQVRDKKTDIFVLAEEVAVFSREWLSKHIAAKDREYIPCMTRNKA